MMPKRQPPHGTCGVCGARTAVTPTPDPRQFVWRCAACGANGNYSWRYNWPAPQWVGPGLRQPSLWDVDDDRAPMNN